MRESAAGKAGTKTKSRTTSAANKKPIVAKKKAGALGLKNKRTGTTGAKKTSGKTIAAGATSSKSST